MMDKELNRCILSAAWLNILHSTVRLEGFSKIAVFLECEISKQFNNHLSSNRWNEVIWVYMYLIFKVPVRTKYSLFAIIVLLIALL